MKKRATIAALIALLANSAALAQPVSPATGIVADALPSQETPQLAAPQTASPPASIDTIAPAPITSEGRRLYDDVKASGTISPDDARRIEAAAEFDPGFFDVAAERALHNRDRVAFLASPSARGDYARDLKRRAQVQAVLSGIIPLENKTRAKFSKLFERLSSTTEKMRALPDSLAESVDEALFNQRLIVHPLCPAGWLNLLTKGSCIRDDPWQRALFLSVVSISLDGKRSCTGAAIAPHLILTAAHCVIETKNGAPSIIDRSRLTVAPVSGTPIAVAAQPHVPSQAIGTCPPCDAYRFDFAVLETDGGRDGGWQPLSVITRLPAPGDVPITIAGYGTTTVPESASPDGFYVGKQRLHLAATTDDFRWSYQFSNGSLSSNCFGDSGGPVFYGSPRHAGDSLALIGVMSRISTSDCSDTTGVAVNLSMSSQAQALCALLPAGMDFCKP